MSAADLAVYFSSAGEVLGLMLSAMVTGFLAGLVALAGMSALGARR